MTRLYAIVGPSAAGKTRMGVETALELAERGHIVEIVSCDSMAVYRGLDISADKPSIEEQRGVRHHLIDIANADEDVTAVAYRDVARETIAAISERGHVPMLVGGSGLWFRAVVDDLEFAPTSIEVRERIARSQREELHERLSELDPASAARIDARNVRRVVRALEIIELTGKPASSFRADWDRREGPYGLTACGLTWEREDLYRRAVERVATELDAGLIGEVRRLSSAGLSKTARQALGVKEMLDYVEGAKTLEEATELLEQNTKRFVRRQLSWFRADPRIDWVNVSLLGWDGARRAIVDRFLASLE